MNNIDMRVENSRTPTILTEEVSLAVGLCTEHVLFPSFDLNLYRIDLNATRISIRSETNNVKNLVPEYQSGLTV